MTQRDYSTGISRCHYIVRDRPIVLKRLPGAIKLSFKPSCADRTFLVRSGAGAYQYTHSRKHKERPASLEIVSLPECFLVDVLGWVKNDDGSLTQGQQPDVRISLLYETENGGRPVRHILYDCTVCQPAFDVTTLGDGLSIDKRTLDIMVNPDPSNGYNFSRQVAKADNAELFDSWFGMRT